jgi:outer membrane protein assembly factor BamB
MNGAFNNNNNGVVGAVVGTCCLILLLTGGNSAIGAVNVTQHHNHLSRDGLYIDPAFTTSNAAALARDTNFNGAIIGDVYAQPLYIEGGPRGRAVVIAVTESNYVFALDATTGDVVWETNVAPCVESGSLPCGNLNPYGITGTPVVDLPSRALFFDAFTTVVSNHTVKHMIYSLNVDTGILNPGWPVDVDNTAAFGKNHFSSSAQGQRGALTVIGPNLYVPYGGLWGDCSTYYGWVVGVTMSEPTKVMAWATTAQKGGIWSVGGIASDGTNEFVATGNTSGASTWGGGEAILRLQPNVVLTNGTTNYWAATNWSTLDGQDLDIGGSGPLIVDVPGATPSNLVVALGKDGYAYLLNRTNLGGITASLAKTSVASGSIIQAAVTYRTAKDTYVVFANNANLNALRINATNPPTITKVWTSFENGSGSPFVTSTDGTNNMIVWGIGAQSDERLHAFDGDTGTNIFTGGAANEAMNSVRGYNTGIVARGHIYVANDNKVYSFVVPGQTVAPITMNNLNIVASGALQFSFTNTQNINFNVFATTNIADPFANWVWLGGVPEISPGQYQFTDTNQPSISDRFYIVNPPQ